MRQYRVPKAHMAQVVQTEARILDTAPLLFAMVDAVLWQHSVTAFRYGLWSESVKRYDFAMWWRSTW